MAYYVDSSAFVKLIVSEQRSTAMRKWARHHNDGLFSCDLLRTESLRAARLHSPEALARARNELEGMTLLVVTTTICERAAELDPGILRSLDALHLAAALTAGDDLDAVVTYDDRQRDAARLLGVAVVSP